MGKTPARCGGRGQIQGKLNRILLKKKKKTEANTAIKQILKHKTHGKRTIRTVQTRKRYVFFFNVHTWRYRSFIKNCSIFVLFLSSQFFFFFNWIQNFVEIMVVTLHCVTVAIRNFRVLKLFKPVLFDC